MITKEVFMDIYSLRKDGWSMRAIARKLGIHRDTVRKHIWGRRIYPAIASASPGHHSLTLSSR